MWKAICLMLSTIIATEAVTIIPELGTLLVPEGGLLRLNCSASNPGVALKWSRQGFGDLETNPSIKLEITGRVADSGDNVSILSHMGVDSTNAGGEYRCFSAKNDSKEATINVKILKVTKEDGLFEYQQGGTLSCGVTLQEGERVTYRWVKDGTVITTMASQKNEKYKDHGNGTLELIKNGITREDAGVHECEIELTDAAGKVGTLNISVTLYAKPVVVPMDKSKNLVQEERLEVECKALGFPKPNITWQKDNVDVKPDDSRIKLSVGNDRPNGKLTIVSLDFDDAGEYKCVAIAADPMFQDRVSGNDTVSSSSVIIIRVKDKLAALWPFLGIVAEVVILCTIIFIYEKKRNKDAAAEDDVNQDGAAPEKNKEGVRHRGNTNNPRA